MNMRYFNRIGVRLFLSILVLVLAVGFIVLIASVEMSRFKGTTSELVDHHINEVRLLTELEHQILQLKTELEEIALASHPQSLRFYVEHVANLEETVEQILASEKKYPDGWTTDVTHSVLEYKSVLDSTAARLSRLGDEVLWAKAQREAEYIVTAIIDPILAGCVFLIQREDHEISELGEQVQSQSSVALAKIIAISTAVILVSSLIAVMLAHSITRPIEHLASLAEDIAEGDLSLRTHIKKKDEIGHLSASFDKMLSQLERVLTEQRLFLADASHELLTPVTVIKGHLQVLKRTPNASAQEQMAAFDTVFAELRRIERMLKGLMALARSSSRELLTLSSVDLPEFMISLFKRAEVFGRRNWYLSESPEIHIRVDRDLLSGALLNLLRNAANYSKEGDRIEFSAHLICKSVRFVVSDTGVGISEKEMPRIFERFYRGGNSAKEGKPGLGLGLSIVKAVVEAHGGDISVESEVGHGTSFYLTIPCHPGDSRPEPAH